MGKPTICIGENKGADQLRSNCEADQRLCFRYMDSTINLPSKSRISHLQPSSVLVQLGLRQTWSESTLLGFPRGGSYIYMAKQYQLLAPLMSSLPLCWLGLVSHILLETASLCPGNREPGSQKETKGQGHCSVLGYQTGSNDDYILAVLQLLRSGRMRRNSVI